jgi:NAD(P)-dependent dehydrogenase (short-subunit alcohol dehydrogenase family)
MSRAVLPFMKKTAPTDGGCIINITATLQDRATPFQLHAAAAKAGIDVATNTVGVEWGEYGIRAIGIAPGGIAGTVGGPGGRVFGKNENKTSANASGLVPSNKQSSTPPPPPPASSGSYRRPFLKGTTRPLVMVLSQTSYATTESQQGGGAESRM